MLRHDFHAHDRVTVLRLFLEYHLLHLSRHGVLEYRSAVLRTEDDVVLTRVDDTVVGMIRFLGLFQSHVYPPDSVYGVKCPRDGLKLLKRMKGLYPGAEAPGVYTL